MPVSGRASSLTKSYKALSTLSPSTLTVAGIAQILKSGANTNAAGVADPNQWQSGKRRDRIASLLGQRHGMCAIGLQLAIPECAAGWFDRGRDGKPFL